MRFPRVQKRILHTLQPAKIRKTKHEIRNKFELPKFKGSKQILRCAQNDRMGQSPSYVSALQAGHLND